MASQEQVREYLAYWFQLGKPVVLQNGRAQCLPAPIFIGNHYSQAFEDCWRQIIAVDGQGCYLEGTDQTIAALMSPAWDLAACARCSMPVPLPEVGLSSEPCPCNDLPSWPNSEVPQPRSAVNTHRHLGDLKQRLEATSER